MSWRMPLVGALLIAAACTDHTELTAPATSSIRKDGGSLTITIRAYPSLDGNDVNVTSFNASDVVAGYRTSPTVRVFRAHPSGSVEYFTPPAGFTPGNFYPFSVGIDYAANVVTSIYSDTAYRAVLWYASGATTLLKPTYPYLGFGVGPLGCGAWARNDSGYTVGTCIPNSNAFATGWNPDLSLMENTCCGVLTAISQNRFQTGYDLTYFTGSHALRGVAGAPSWEILGPLYSGGLSINNNGWVAGYYGIGDSSAVLWVPGTADVVLAAHGVARGIDNNGFVVGYHRTSSTSPTTAFLWTPSGGLVDLPRNLPILAGGTQSAAMAINANKEILGWATDKAGNRHTVIWTFSE